MKKRIEVWNSTITSDAGGNTETSTKVTDCWARVDQLSQSRSLAYGLTENFKNYEITVRYNESITTRCWLIFGSKKLIISSILNSGSNNIEMKLIASENE